MHPLQVGRISWSIFHRNELILVVRPGRLAAIQSTKGLSLFTLQGTSSLEPGLPEWATFISSKCLYNDFSLIVSILSRCTNNCQPMGTWIIYENLTDKKAVKNGQNLQWSVHIWSKLANICPKMSKISKISQKMSKSKPDIYKIMQKCPKICKNCLN